MQNDKPTFRTAVGGFNKQDVNEYIASLSEGFAKEKAEYEKKLDDLIELSESLRKKLEIEPQNDSADNNATVELDRANALIEEQNKQLSEKQSQIDSLNAALKAKTDELDALRTDAERYKDCDEKLREYDRMSQKMGELMLKAASSAEQIKTDAEIEAARTLRESEEKKKELKTRQSEMERTLDTRYQNAIAAINRKLTELVNEGFDTLKASMGSADDELASMLDKRRSAAKAAVLRTAESLPELKELAGLGDSE